MSTSSFESSVVEWLFFSITLLIYLLSQEEIRPPQFVLLAIEKEKSLSSWYLKLYSTDNKWNWTFKVFKVGI